MKHIHYVVLLTTLFFCVSCDPFEKETEVNSTEKPETPTLSLKDISGVWVDPANEWYYISIYPSGRYTYCFNEKLIGSGTCELENDQLTLHNNYTYSSDVVKISLNLGQLQIKGEVSDWNLNKTSVFQEFDLSKEEFSQSVVGANISASGGVYKNYDKVKKEITFISDVNFIYESTGKLKTTGEWKTISDKMWYYVYRKPYTYGLRIGGDNLVEIYKFGFTEEPGYRLSFNLEDYRVN